MLHTVCRRYTLTQDELPPVLACPRAKAVLYAHWGCVCWVNRTTIISHCLLFLTRRRPRWSMLFIFISVQLSSSLLTTVIRLLWFRPLPAADSPLAKSCTKELQKAQRPISSQRHKTQLLLRSLSGSASDFESRQGFSCIMPSWCRRRRRTCQITGPMFSKVE